MTTPMISFKPREFYSDFSPTHTENGKPVMLIAEHTFFEYVEIAIRDRRGNVGWFKKEIWDGVEI